MKNSKRLMTGSIYMLLALFLTSMMAFAAPNGENGGNQITEISSSEMEVTIDFSGENYFIFDLGKVMSDTLLKRATMEEMEDGILLQVLETNEMLGEYAPVEAWIRNGEVVVATPRDPGKFYCKVKGTLQAKPSESHIITLKIIMKEPKDRCATLKGKIVFPKEYYEGYIMSEKATVIAVRKGTPKYSEQNAPTNVGVNYFITETDEEDKFSMRVPAGEYYLQFKNSDLLLNAVVGDQANPTIFTVKCDSIVNVPDVPVVSYLSSDTKGQGYIRGSFTVNERKDIKHVKIYAVPTTRNPLYYTRPGIKFEAEKANNLGLNQMWEILTPKGEFQVIAEYRGTVINNPDYIIFVYYEMMGHTVFHFDFTDVAPAIQHTIGGVLQNENNSIKGFVTLIKKPETAASDFKLLNMPTEQGRFEFKDVKPGKYMLFAVPLQGSYMPGFYREGTTASSIWEEATEIDIPSDATASVSVDCVIELATIGSNNGSGKIAGKVAANPASGKVVSGFSANAEPIRDVIMSVYDAQGRPVRSGKTDKNGAFSFKDLLAGTYKISASMYGYTSLTQNITIGSDDNDRDFNGANFYLEPAMSNVKDAKELSVYPNPAKAMVSIDFPAEAGNANISIIDALGNVVYSNTITTVDGDNSYKYNTQNMANGLYLITIELNNGKRISTLLTVIK